MNNEAIDTFIIHTVLIDPIADIITKLKNRDFRDCDINWLEKKLKGYLDFAGQILDVRVPAIFESDMRGVTLNDYTTNNYLNKFKTLLNFFKQWG